MSTDQPPPDAGRFSFCFQGISVSVFSDSAEVLDALKVDFGALDFMPQKPSYKSIQLYCWKSECHQALPAIRASMVQPRYASFENSDERWVDYYNGEALVRWQKREDRGVLWTKNNELLHEVAYLIILARLGELLEEQGYHRVHALGLAAGGAGIMLLLPSGGGKTTLSMKAISLPQVKLLSDDLTLAKSDGTLIGFPVRIGVCGKPHNIDEKHLRYFQRREFDAKWLIDLNAFRDKLETTAPARCTLIGVRNLNAPARIVPAGRVSAFKAFFSGMVVGVGVPQLVELFLGLDWQGLVFRIWLTARRLYAAVRLVFLTRSYFFELSRSPEENFAVFQKFLAEFEPSP